MKGPLVSIIVINYNTFALARACIDSVIHYTTDVSYEIILIENGTGQFTQETMPWADPVRLIVSDKNLGFAGANNLGIRHARGAYILLLNSDTLLKEDSVSQCVHFIAQRPDVAVVSPRLVYPDGRHQSVAQRFPSVRTGLIELLRLQKLMSKRRAGEVLLGAFFDHRTTMEVDWVWGAFFLLRREVLDKMPGRQLDDTYFMYWEDVQWCMDIARLNYKVMFFAGTEVIHIHEGSKANKSEMMANNARIFMKRNYSPWAIWSIRLINNCLSK